MTEMETTKSKSYLDLMLLGAVGIAVLALQLGSSRFWDQDEGYYATVASEMFRRGDWIVPTFNDVLFAHKPPMMYWGMLASFQCFGESEFAARLPSALFGFGCAWLTYVLASRLFDRRVGLFAGLALQSCLMFTVVSRSATADVHLTFFVLLALMLWSRAAFSRSQAEISPTRALPIVNRASPIVIGWSTWVVVYASMALAVLSKGPIGLAFPMTILAATHLWEPWTQGLATGRSWRESLIQWLRCLSPRHVVATILGMRPFTGAAVLALVAGPWFLAMHWKTDGAFLSEFLGVHHFNRFSQAMDNHSGPIFYYAIACLIGLYPWTAFVIPTVLQWAQPAMRASHRRAWVFLNLWIATYLVVFSLASTKLPNYVVPAYPAMAIVIACYFATWWHDGTVAAVRWQYAGWVCFVLIGMTILVVPLVITSESVAPAWMDPFDLDEHMVPTLRWASLLGLPLAVGGLLGLWLRYQGKKEWMAPCFATASVAMLVLFWQVLVPMADKHQTPQDIAASIPLEDTRSGEPPSIAVLRYFRPSMVYYARRPIDFCIDAKALSEHLAQRPSTIVVLKEDALDEVRSQLPSGYRIVETYPEFPNRGKVLVLRPPLVR